MLTQQTFFRMSQSTTLSSSTQFWTTHVHISSGDSRSRSVLRTFRVCWAPAYRIFQAHKAVSLALGLAAASFQWAAESHAFEHPKWNPFRLSHNWFALVSAISISKYELSKAYLLGVKDLLWEQDSPPILLGSVYLLTQWEQRIHTRPFCYWQDIRSFGIRESKRNSTVLPSNIINHVVWAENAQSDYRSTMQISSHISKVIRFLPSKRPCGFPTAIAEAERIEIFRN